MELGLALSGGGVRGAAHIGILKALEESNIKPQFISGASSGSIIAALYAVGYKPIEVEEIFLSIGKNIIDHDYVGLVKFTIGMIMKQKVKVDGFIKGDKIEKLIYELTAKKGIINISSTKIPLAISAVDINTSDTIMFTSNKVNNRNYINYCTAKISEAVRASISFPFIFKPKIYNGRRLVDGGVRENVPVDVLKDMGAKKIIAINLGYCGEHINHIDNILEIVNQTIDIMTYSIFKNEIHDIDILLRPKIYDVKLLEVDRIDECIKRGYNYAKSMILNIKEKLALTNS